jgi:uncharacterized metal-binding protein YceD (DUF177 family)
VPIQVTDVPETGRRFELTADGETREAVAKVAGVVALPRLEATFDLAPLANDGVRVTGMVSASVEQICVVTLDPMTSQIEEQIDLVFVPSGASVQPKDATMLGASDDSDPPETLQNGVLDLGAVATEFLVLGINPYPRKPDATFEGAGADDTKANPFAALAALKKAPGAKPR